MALLLAASNYLRLAVLPALHAALPGSKPCLPWKSAALCSLLRHHRSCSCCLLAGCRWTAALFHSLYVTAIRRHATHLMRL